MYQIKMWSFEVEVNCCYIISLRCPLIHSLHCLQTLLESMVDAAESVCPHVMKRSNLRPELVKASSVKMVVPKSFVTKTLLEQSGVDIINKIRYVCWIAFVCISFLTFRKQSTELCLGFLWVSGSCFVLPDHHCFSLCGSARWSWVWRPSCPIAL